MEKTLIWIIAALVALGVATSSFAGGGGTIMMVGGTAASGTCADPVTSYAVWENFNGANSDNASVSGYNQTGWNAVGTHSIGGAVTLDSGSGCGNAIALDSATDNADVSTYNAFSAADNVYGYLVMRFTGHASAVKYHVAFSGSTGTTTMKFGPRTTGQVTLFHGAASSSSTEDEGTAALTDNTNYHVWFGYRKGTGADGYAYTCFSADTTKPDIADTTKCLEKTDGSSTAQSARLYLWSDYSTTGQIVYFDHVRVSTTDIGSNPD